MLGGLIGDKVGPLKVIWFSILGILPFTLALPHVGLAATGALTVVIGLILASAFPAIVVFAPGAGAGRTGLIAGSSLALPLAWAVSPPPCQGVIADAKDRVRLSDLRLSAADGAVDDIPARMDRLCSAPGRCPGPRIFGHERMTTSIKVRPVSARGICALRRIAGGARCADAMINAGRCERHHALATVERGGARRSSRSSGPSR